MWDFIDWVYIYRGDRSLYMLWLGNAYIFLHVLRKTKSSAWQNTAYALYCVKHYASVGVPFNWNGTALRFGR